MRPISKGQKRFSRLYLGLTFSICLCLCVFAPDYITVATSGRTHTLKVSAKDCDGTIKMLHFDTSGMIEKVYPFNVVITDPRPSYRRHKNDTFEIHARVARKWVKVAEGRFDIEEVPPMPLCLTLDTPADTGLYNDFKKLFEVRKCL